MPKTVEELESEIAKMKTDNETLQKKVTEWETKGKEIPPAPPKEKEKEKESSDDDLVDKTRKTEKTDLEKRAESKSLESAIKFNMVIGEFVKSHEQLLPAEVGKILETAEKERYDSEVEKAGALKSAVIQSFFSVQSNLDLLTDSQKESLTDYLKLTKAARESKAADAYANIFEPTIAMAKRIHKAEELGKARNGMVGTGNTVQEQYKKRLVEGSQKAHLGK